MEARQVAGEPVGGPTIGLVGSGRRRAAVGAAGVCREERLEVPVGHECLDLVAVTSRFRAGHRDGSSRSRATLRRARWIRTRTAPSDRPRTPAISAVDISSTKRRIERPASIVGEPTDRRPGRGGLVPRPASASMSTGAATELGRLERRLGWRRSRRRRSATALRAIWKSQTRNVEAPSPSVGRARSSNRARFAERRGTSAPSHPPPRDGRAARRTRSCTPGPGTSDRALRTGPGPPAPPRPADGRGRGGRARAPLLRPIPLPECRSGHGVTPPRDRIDQPDMPDLADEDVAACRAGWVARSTTRAPVRDVHAERAHRPRRRRASRAAPSGRGHLALGAARRRRSARSAARRPGVSRCASERARACRPGRPDRPATSEARSSRRRAHAGSPRPPQSALRPIPTTTRGSPVPRPLALAEHPGQLAGIAARLRHRAKTRSFGHLSRTEP